VDRATAENDLALGVRRFQPAVLQILDPRSAASREQQSRCMSPRRDCQVGSFQRRTQIGSCRALTAAVADRAVILADTFLLRSVEVVCLRISRLTSRRTKGITERIGALTGDDGQG